MDRFLSYLWSIISPFNTPIPHERKRWNQMDGWIREEGKEMEDEEVSGHGLVRKKIRFLNSLILFMENSFLADPTHANDFLSFLSLPVSFSQLCTKLCRSVLLFYAIWYVVINIGVSSFVFVFFFPLRSLFLFFFFIYMKNIIYS